MKTRSTARWRWVWVVASGLLCSGCERPHEAARTPTLPLAEANPTRQGATNISFYQLTASKLEGYLRYQKARVSQRETRPGVQLGELRQAAALDDEARKKAGLTDEDVRQIDAMVGEMVRARNLVASLSADGAIEAWENMREKLAPAQRAELDKSIGQMVRERDEARQLTRARARYGDSNVNLLLTREGELAKGYLAWLEKAAN